jgi:hypothetical protein
VSKCSGMDERASRKVAAEGGDGCRGWLSTEGEEENGGGGGRVVTKGRWEGGGGAVHGEVKGGSPVTGRSCGRQYQAACAARVRRRSRGAGLLASGLVWGMVGQASIGPVRGP